MRAIVFYKINFYQKILELLKLFCIFIIVTAQLGILIKGNTKQNKILQEFCVFAESVQSLSSIYNSKNILDKISLEISGPSFLIKGIPAKYSITFENKKSQQNTLSYSDLTTISTNSTKESDKVISDRNITQDSSLKFHYKVTLNSEVILEGFDTLDKISEITITPNITGKTKLKFEIENVSKEVEVRIIHGLLSLLPPFLAIFLALILKEVFISLFIGAYVGSIIVFDFQPFIGFLRTIDKYILEALADSSHSAIIIFSITLGGMIGVINRTGGMQGIVNIISKLVQGPKTAQLATSLMGITIFFDDYANTLIVGNSMRPITDKYKISREKLSYIVDSTSAPIAGIALISTWIGYEIGIIRQVFIDLNIPETNFYSIFLKTLPYRFYCILTIFFVLFICILGKDYSFMYEAEKRARLEGKLLRDGANPIATVDYTLEQLPQDIPKRWYNAAIPILFVILGTLIGLFYNGNGFVQHFYASQITINSNSSTLGNNNISSSSTIISHTNSITLKNIKVLKLLPELNLIIGENEYKDILKFILINKNQTQELLHSISPNQIINIEIDLEKSKNITLTDKIRYAFSDANSQIVLLWISISGSILAIILGFIQKIVTLEQGIKAWLSGAKSMMLAMCVLILAWSINSICKDLKTADYLVSILKGVLQPWLIPTLTFISACLISFSTGTSWGTMAILLPISIPIAFNLHSHYYDNYLAQISALSKIEYIKQMLLLSIGAVLEGSIFGDHCSPISDTTIMSSMASGADHIDHVKTQIPYALTVAFVALTLCYIPASLGFSPYICILISLVILFLFINLYGKSINL